VYTLVLPVKFLQHGYHLAKQILAAAIQMQILHHFQQNEIPASTHLQPKVTYMQGRFKQVSK